MDSALSTRMRRRDDHTLQAIERIIGRIVRELIDDTETCEITITQAGSLFLIEVVPGSPRAAGQLIGRNGRTIASLRTIATAICAKYGWRAQLEIVA